MSIDDKKYENIRPFVNKIFMEMAEFIEVELLGKTHNIIRHQDMPKAVFKLLWDMVQDGEEIFAYVLNKTKNGNTYIHRFEQTFADLNTLINDTSTIAQNTQNRLFSWLYYL